MLLPDNKGQVSTILPFLGKRQSRQISNCSHREFARKLQLSKLAGTIAEKLHITLIDDGISKEDDMILCYQSSSGGMAEW
jgi:hypothetical protein